MLNFIRRLFAKRKKAIRYLGVDYENIDHLAPGEKINLAGQVFTNRQDAQAYFDQQKAVVVKIKIPL